MNNKQIRCELVGFETRLVWISCQYNINSICQRLVFVGILTNVFLPIMTTLCSVSFLNLFKSFGMVHGWILFDTVISRICNNHFKKETHGTYKN